ncbi:MAG: hypothetical protein ACQESN_06065 [Thermotogota bacterium]
MLKERYSFSNPKLSSQFEFIKIMKDEKNTEYIKKIAKLRRGNTKENVENNNEKPNY